MVGFDPHPKRRPALVTGASSCIGAAIASALAQAGHPVALGARRLSRSKELAATIQAGGGEAFVHKLDVGDGDSVAAFATAAADALGPIEIVVSCAGDLTAARVHEMDSEEFLAQVRLHLMGLQRLVSLVVPGMIARRRGDIVFVSSDAVRMPGTWRAAYVTAKYGIEGMARTMQMKLEGSGVRASIVRPGPPLTGMNMDWDAETTTEVLEDWVKWGLVRHPSSLRPADIAAAVTTVVTAPRGTHLALIEVQPEAPVETP